MSANENEIPWNDDPPRSASRVFSGRVLLLLAVLLILPWYWHGARLMLEERSARQAQAEWRERENARQEELRRSTQAREIAARETEAVQEAQINAALDEQEFLVKQQAEAAESSARTARIAQVRVMGVLNGNPSTVIVDLADAEFSEARAAICEQAQRLLREPVHGREILLQRYRGASPALDIGMVACD